MSEVKKLDQCWANAVVASAQRWADTGPMRRSGICPASGRCWADVRQMLGQCRANVGPMSGRCRADVYKHGVGYNCWASVGIAPALARHRSNIGPRLAQHRPDAGQMPDWRIGPASAQRWADVGPALAQRWTNAGPALVQFLTPNMVLSLHLTI